jgi:hypothetical protein
MTTARHLQRREIPPDVLVLGERPLRGGMDREQTSRFADDRWDLTPADHKQHNRRLILNFAALPARFRQGAKELFFALLAGSPPKGERELGIDTIRGHFTRVRVFLTWAEQRGRPAVAALTIEDLEAYQHYVLTLRGSPGWRNVLRRSVRLFWLYRDHLFTDRLVLDPYRLDEWADQSSRLGRGENRTLRIPEQVIGPLLGWALRWVEEFADDVLRANDEWTALYVNTGPNRTRRHARARHSRARLTAVLDRYRGERRPLPGSPGGINHAHLAREVGCSPGALQVPALASLITAAAGELGVANGTWLRAEMRAPVDDRPWRSAIGYEELPQVARLLHTACYLVIAYLSGMRDSEVKHLRRGCVGVRRDNTGRVYRRTVTSQAFKGETSPAGVEATWVVGEPVERAIAVLERLQPPDQPLLFARLPSSTHANRQHVNTAKTTQQTSRDLAEFVEWVNGFCDAHGLPDRLPLVNNQCWHLTTGQFRRTLAWFIARRPGGVIAGAIQYRHQRVQMFEGYAGTSASGFRAEVEAEQALERGEQLLAMVEGHEPQQLAGPAAEEAQARLKELGRHAAAKFPGTVVADQRRLQLIMRRHDPNVFPGRFVTCVFNPDKALCLRSKGDGRGPVLPDCKPLQCRNVALTPANLAAWRQQLARLDQALASADVLAPYVRDRLRQQRDQIARFLAETDHSPEELA